MNSIHRPRQILIDVGEQYFAPTSDMADLTSLPTRLDGRQLQCKAIIETPKGRRNKFDYDRESNLFRLGGLLPEGMAFPFDFGFVPSTLGEDGDPLDVMC